MYHYFSLSLLFPRTKGLLLSFFKRFTTLNYFVTLLFSSFPYFTTKDQLLSALERLIMLIIPSFESAYIIVFQSALKGFIINNVDHYEHTLKKNLKCVKVVWDTLQYFQE